jgi:hypothetical protein
MNHDPGNEFLSFNQWCGSGSARKSLPLKRTTTYNILKFFIQMHSQDWYGGSQISMVVGEMSKITKRKENLSTKKFVFKKRIS